MWKIAGAAERQSELSKVSQDIYTVRLFYLFLSLSLSLAGFTNRFFITPVTRCGRLHCDTHSLFQMKLDRTCLHSPETGIWCRVCQSCYQCRDGYLDSFGRSNNITREYTRVRRDKIGHVLLEVNMLEKRLEKLTRLHVDFAVAGKKGPLHQASIKGTYLYIYDIDKECDIS